MIDTYLLLQLEAFKRLGTLSAVAEEIHITQPSVTRGMKRLEDYFGVSLFVHDKNKITLNQNGELASKYASRILSLENEMKNHIITLDKSYRSISIGCCAPGPLMILLSQATGMFPEYSISSEITTEKELINGLKNEKYQIIILPFNLINEEVYCKECFSEHLQISINALHPASSFSTVSFKQMDGQNFIMLSEVGIWEALVKKMMPNAKFFKQEDMEALSTLVSNSELPSFSTNITTKELQWKNNRLNIPFKDNEATIQFFIACKMKNQKKFQRFIEVISSIKE